MPQDPRALVWIDLEMTGLYPDRDRIIEIATIVTDSNLEVIAEGPVIAVHQSDELLAGMDEWNPKTHNESGLVERVKCSAHTEQGAEEETLEDVVENQNLARRLSEFDGITGALMAPHELELFHGEVLLTKLS